MLSQKQIDSLERSTHRINIWEGAVRSGKSFISILRFLEAIKTGPPGDAMIVGFSRDSLQRNIVLEICKWLPIRVPTPKATMMHICGRTVHIVGASDERAQRRIQGSTLALAYVDEITALPEGFFRMLLTRLSITGSQLFGTCNPDSPYHWLKKNFLDRSDEIDIVSFPFRITDNPSLSAQIIKDIKREHAGLYYKRYVEGQWVLADGLVYDHFDHEQHTLEWCPPAQYYTVGIDYGTTNPTAFVLIGHNPKEFPNHWVEKEYYWDSNREHIYKTDTDYAEDLVRFCRGYQIRKIYLDPTAISFRSELKRFRELPPVVPAQNEVVDGIRFVSKLLANGDLKLRRSLHHIMQEIASYAWDPSASKQGLDRPIKSHDHLLDALRYAIYTELFRQNPTQVDQDAVRETYHEAVAQGRIRPVYRPMIGVR